ncbi:nonstructural protein [Blackfly microvirus SF02]|uniref:Nonstructural protein n=1 Tax=Blackfly microvirus SF02 TaxID=2576452 RepID=A0A4P8PK78_9VIRU|nr:nonstructural protein [Blackfly microvirus SF02]
MVLKLFTIRDTKAGNYNAPFAQKSHGEAERTLKELTSDPQSLLHKYPEDYDLYFLGDYDDISGKMVLKDTPQHVIKAAQVAPKAQA